MIIKKRTNKQNQGKRKNLDPFTVIKLWTRAGGRCEFHGCNEYLLTDDLTLEEANFANIAHIVAVKENGPRGNDLLPFEERNNIKNLMLLCRKHHKLVDDKKLIKKYPTELLHKFKKQHESRIIYLTDIKDENKTFVVRLRAKINGKSVMVRRDHIKEAIYPMYPADKEGMEIDLTSLCGDDDMYWKMGQKIISEKVEKIFRHGIEKKEIDHVSVFAIGPMPFLIYLGSQLCSAIETDLFHLQKESEDWVWKTDGKTIKYKMKLLSKGNKQSKMALLLSLSGQINKEDLPDFINNDYWVYEITLDGVTPNRMFMRKRNDLLEFKKIYRQFLSHIKKNHNEIKEIVLFPAVPPPVAVLCGRELIEKADPSLLVYDFNKNRGGFRKTLKIN